MNLKIPNSKAIETLRKRIGELGGYDFQPKVWKDKTQNDLREIFPLGDTKWLEVRGINFTTYITSEKEQVMGEGKVQARQLLESYIEQIQEYYSGSMISPLSCRGGLHEGVYRTLCTLMRG